MTRVIHTGDTHLGYRQYHSDARREDFLAAFRQVVEDAVAGEVDAVVHAGDLFHDRRPALDDLLGALAALRELDGADVPFLAIVGNHETKRTTQWLDLFESLGLATRLGAEPVVVGDTAFYGLDFVPRSRRDDLEYAFEPHDADHAALVAHGLFEPFDLGDWDASEVLSTAAVDFDAMLLGDNHTPGTKRVDGTWLTYCGSTERTSADERADRGYNLVAFGDDAGGAEGTDDPDGGAGAVRISRRGLPTREFRYVDVELSDGEGVERVAERVGQYDVSDAVVAVTIDGEGEPVAPARVEELLDAGGALVARVTDRRSTPERSEVEVSFADPDDAVRERVRELGLSEAARDVDETVRASKVADSNVADAVEERVRELVEAGDESAFAPAEGAGSAAEDADSAADGATDDEAGEATDDEAGEATDDEGDGATAGDAARDGEAAEPSEEASPDGARPEGESERADGESDRPDGGAGGEPEEGAADRPESEAVDGALAEESDAPEERGTERPEDGDGEVAAPVGTDDQSSLGDY